MAPVKILIVIPALNASSVICITRPLIELERRGLVTLRLRYSAIHFGWRKDCDWCDIAVFNRSQGFSDLRALYYLKQQGKKVIYDIDDNFLEIPMSMSVAQEHRYYTKIHGTTQFYKYADLTRVYTERMRAQAAHYSGQPELTRIYFDGSILDGLPAPRKSPKVRIAFASAREDDPTLSQIITDALSQISDEFGDQIELHFWRKPKGSLATKSNIIVHAPTHRYEEFVKNFYNLGFDIGIAPFLDHPFYHSKTNNKFREYGGTGVAGIYSDVPPYNESVQHLETGYLTKNSVEDWVTALRYMITNQDARAHIAAQARTHIATHYSFDATVAVWHSQIQNLMKTSSPPITQDIPYLTNNRAFPLWVLVGHADDGSDHVARRAILISHLSQYCGHLRVNLKLSFLDQFGVSQFMSPTARYYAVIQESRDLELLSSLVSKNEFLAVDIRIMDGFNAAVHAILARLNKDNVTIICTTTQAHELNLDHLLVLDSVQNYFMLDYYQPEFSGLNLYQFLELFCYNTPYSRKDMLIQRWKTIRENGHTTYRTLRRRMGQMWDLLLWRLGIRTQ